MPRTYAAASALMLAVAIITTGGAVAVTSTGAVPGFIAAAVADRGRPEGDRNRDALRKPIETLQFSGIKPGDVVADYNARGGYFTRLFADVVGPRGRVYAVQPIETLQYVQKEADDLETWALRQPNITILVGPAVESVRLPRKLDVFWISQNYHDLFNKNFGPADVAAFNKGVFAALKPGGTYIVLDHRAAAGAPTDVTEKLHRIEPATVRRDVEAAGFHFEAESTILANPADHHTLSIFDDSMHDQTDQFILKFRRP